MRLRLKQLLNQIPFVHFDGKTSQNAPGYPPDEVGYHYHSVKDLLRRQASILSRIRITYGVNPKFFDEFYMPVIENLANYVQLLPASEAHHHHGQGGLLRHSLEVAWNAGEIYSGKIMSPEKSPEFRRKYESQWRLAAFIASLCHDIGKAAYDVTVTDNKGEQEWNPNIETLGQWLKNNEIDTYFVRWNKTRKHNSHNHFALRPLTVVVPKRTIFYLSRNVEEAMENAMLGDVNDYNTQIVYDMVKEADSLSVKTDLKRSGTYTGTGQTNATPVVRYITLAMRQLYDDNIWQVNKPGGRIWISSDGVFIVWKKAVTEILDRLDDDGINGIPHDHEKLATILYDSNMIKPYVNYQGMSNPYWTIVPHSEKTDASLRLAAINLNNFEIISGHQPTSYAQITIIDQAKEYAQYRKDKIITPSQESDGTPVRTEDETTLVKQETEAQPPKNVAASQQNKDNTDSGLKTMSAADLIKQQKQAATLPKEKIELDSHVGHQQKKPSKKTALTPICPATLSSDKEKISNKTGDKAREDVTGSASVKKTTQALNSTLRDLLNDLRTAGGLSHFWQKDEQVALDYPVALRLTDKDQAIKRLEKIKPFLQLRPGSPTIYVHEGGYLLFNTPESALLINAFKQHGITLVTKKKPAPTSPEEKITPPETQKKIRQPVKRKTKTIDAQKRTSAQISLPLQQPTLPQKQSAQPVASDETKKVTTTPIDYAAFYAFCEQHEHLPPGKEVFIISTKTLNAFIKQHGLKHYEIHDFMKAAHKQLIINKEATGKDAQRCFIRELTNKKEASHSER